MPMNVVTIVDNHSSAMREKFKALECSEMARFQIKKIVGRRDGRRFRGHSLLLIYLYFSNKQARNFNFVENPNRIKI